MDFYAMLDQVVNLLRSRGRVSYRALKRQFALDDELLADLKAELRYAHYPVVEDDDQGLVWTGETGPPSEHTHPPPPPETVLDLGPALSQQSYFLLPAHEGGETGAAGRLQATARRTLRQDLIDLQRLGESLEERRA